MKKWNWKWVFICITAAVLATIALLRYMSWRRMNEPLAEVAKAAFVALSKGDADQLERMIVPAEMVASKFSRTSFRSFVKWSHEGISDWRVNSAPVEQLSNPSDSSLWCLREVIGTSGHKAYVSINVFRTEDGARISVISNMVLHGFIGRYGNQFAEEPATLWAYKSCQVGLKKERGKLEAMKIYGFAKDNGKEFFYMDWDQCEKFQNKVVEKEIKAKQKFGQ